LVNYQDYTEMHGQQNKKKQKAKSSVQWLLHRFEITFICFGKP